MIGAWTHEFRLKKSYNKNCSILGCIEERIPVFDLTSASFEIPNDLHDNRIQLIWLKQDASQCVCPPFEQFMSQCACNVDGPNINTITISNSTLTISNLAQNMGRDEVTLHFISSVSDGCHLNCNLRKIKKIYRITFTQGILYTIMLHAWGLQYSVVSVCLSVTVSFFGAQSLQLVDLCNWFR